MFTDKLSKLKWWHVALISVVASGIGGLSARKNRNKQEKIYKKQKQAPWAPPAAVFAPAWTANNFFILMALKRLLASDNPDKKKLLALQAMIWTVYFSFNYVNFYKKSPILGAVWTMADAGLAAASFTLALKSDKKLAFMYLPLLGWTSFATSLADYQALKNDDPVFETKALLA